MNTIHFIHISDLHFRLDWEENQGKVLAAFFDDLSTQVENLRPDTVYFVLSGDVVLAGGNENLYSSVLEILEKELNKNSINSDKRICIPGNHDVDVNYVKNKFFEHNGIVTQLLDETSFNNYLQSRPAMLREKFDKYLSFELQFSDYHLLDIGGKGLIINESIGLYSLNTSLLSSGGHNKIDDKQKLSIDTRSLHKWLHDCKCPVKVLVMHHPLNWLTPWASHELKSIIENNFQLVFSGHEHTQDLFHSIVKSNNLVYCSAPPLFTHKADELGYAIVSISEQGVNKISYRQWTKRGAFVRGVNFTDNEEGYIAIERPEQSNNAIDTKRIETEVLLKKNLDDALKSFSSQPVLWIDRVLDVSPPTRTFDHKKSEEIIEAIEIVEKESDFVIKAPAQFGLTCLSHYLAYHAWKKKAHIWIYLDFDGLKLHALEKEINNRLRDINIEGKIPNAICIDNWNKAEKHAAKFLQKIKGAYPECNIILFNRIDDNEFTSDPEPDIYDVYYLMPLPRNEIRKAVCAYNSHIPIADDEIILKKIVTDLDVLNVHRTPLNCLTLLKAFETNFDESPVNRAELIHNVLYVLFQVDNIPTYKSKPDLKDCEFVLAYFCAKIVQKKDSPIFTREYFIQDLNKYCGEKTIDLEVSLVFDVLYNNNIIIRKSNGFTFRFAYWVYYFAALYIKFDDDFSNYIFSENHYTAFPEIIEYYTGSDRVREDALTILTNDLAAINKAVDEKVGLPVDMNPYKHLTWNPSPAIIEQMNASLGEDVQVSKLPIEVKDQYEDFGYDVTQPSNQGIREIFKEYNLLFLWAAARCAARALRNSDYANTSIKERLLDQISESWSLISKVLIAISPILAEQRAAAFDGQGFVLIGNWPTDSNKRWAAVLAEVSSNIVRWFQDDISSQKMGPLLFKTFEAQTDPLKKHQLALIIIKERPRHWKNIIQKHIEELHKNSYYLYDIHNVLYTARDYESLNANETKDIEALIKSSLSKHSFGTTSKANRFDNRLGEKPD